MTQIIEAYFKNEDQALENEANLKKEFDVDILEVGPLEGRMKTDSTFLLPFIPVAGTNATTGTGVGGAGAAGSRAAGRLAVFKETTKDKTENGQNENEDGHVDYIISAKVKEKDVEDITNLLRNNHGHVKVSKP